MSPPHRTRIVLCMGRYCNQHGRAVPLEDLLTERLGGRGPLYRMTGTVVWEVASCLSMCGAGPNAVIYPEDRSANHLDIASLTQLVDALLAQEEDDDPKPCG